MDGRESCPKPFPSDPFRKVSMSADDAAPLRYYADPKYLKTIKIQQPQQKTHPNLAMSSTKTNQNPMKSYEIL